MLYAKNNNPSEAAYFAIRNLMRQIFLKGTAINHHPIDISHLSSGSYLLNISNGKSLIVKRFIK
ncbi:T9SS type A sorting domain-containing protein [Tamlana flava]|uniref:T9SS type A sorting domain-containing protein n=1 Tax=Tamlana flava TaxID=3158572 RepID=UPI00351BB2D8